MAGGELSILYASKKADIKQRLEQFKKNWFENDRRIFSELAFCLCTPQTKASASDKAVKQAADSNLLFVGRAEDIAPILTKSGVRFANNKARYIVDARNYFSKEGDLKIRSKLNTDDIWGLRNWLADNVNGLGMKEASHFLRNMGFGKDVAILDRHILRCLVKYGVISEEPKTLTKQKYLEIEQRMRELSKKVNIAMDELDMLFWSEYGSLPIEEMK